MKKEVKRFFGFFIFVFIYSLRLSSWSPIYLLSPLFHLLPISLPDHILPCSRDCICRFERFILQVRQSFIFSLLLRSYSHYNSGYACSMEYNLVPEPTMSDQERVFFDRAALKRWWSFVRYALPVLGYRSWSGFDRFDELSEGTRTILRGGTHIDILASFGWGLLEFCFFGIEILWSCVRFFSSPLRRGVRGFFLRYLCLLSYPCDLARHSIWWSEWEWSLIHTDHLIDWSACSIHEIPIEFCDLSRFWESRIIQDGGEELFGIFISSTSREPDCLVVPGDPWLISYIVRYIVGQIGIDERYCLCQSLFLEHYENSEYRYTDGEEFYFQRGK